MKTSADFYKMFEMFEKFEKFHTHRIIWKSLRREIKVSNSLLTTTAEKVDLKN